jgi:hypothetical protein
MDDLTQLGIGGLTAVLVIREVLTFLRDRRNSQGNDDNDANLSTLCQQVGELHQWHSVTDGNGVKVWYVRRSLEEAIRELATNIRTQTDILKELMRETKGTRREVERLHDASRSD